MRDQATKYCIAIAILAAVAIASKDHYNPYKEGGYYHFDHRGIPHWHPGRYHYHDYEEYVYRSPKYLRYVSEPETKVTTHVERVPTYSRTYEVPTTYRQVETQYHRPDDKTIIEKKIYKQDVPAHYHVKTTHIDGTRVHYHKA